MSVDRKNIFLIGRRGHERDEDQLTEMLAFLWQEQPETLSAWLSSIGLSHGARAEVETQFVIPSGRRPDIAIRSEGATTLVESKLDAGFHDTQVSSYLEYLGTQPGRRALVMLTDKPEGVPEHDRQLAASLGVELIASRWHHMADVIAEPGEESLAGDFVQLLIREGLVTPKPFAGADWSAWNAGFAVLLRVETFLNELDPHVKSILPAAKKSGTQGLSKRWIYHVWRTGNLEIGLGLAASTGDSSADGDPIVFAFVGNKDASLDQALNAVGLEKSKRYEWSQRPDLSATCGLLYDWPCLIRPAEGVLGKPTFEEQRDAALAFMRFTLEHFRARGYMPGA